MPLCLSFFQRKDDAVLRNHAHYCRSFGYDHQWTDADHILHPALRDGARYSEILRRLRKLVDGDWLLYLDGDSVVFHPVAIETLMEGRDLLVLEGPAVGEHSGLAMTNMMVLRNMPANRALLHQLIEDCGRVIALVTDRLDEAARLRPAGMLACNATIGDIYVNVSWRISQWFHARIFVVNLGPLPIAAPGSGLREDMLHDFNLQRLLVDQVNDALMHGRPVMQSAAYPELSTDALTTHNPGGHIAFLTLYTHHINSYARISEHNVKRYCERHGYTYHVYRAVPEEIGPSINGSWVRTWLLQQHLAQHDWIIWIDADTLFLNQTRRIDDLLQGRDLLLGKDVGAWSFNSGVMGFRNTARNAELLASIWARIGGVDDKSTVYASQGDQYYTNEVLTAEGLVGPENILDNLSINTPPHLATEETLLVHFINLGEPYRSAYMAALDARAQRLR